ncbi:MAG: ATP-binding domain-containing protein, partial [Bdellovibrionales bacterium]|nr:ATP-binding domain-containing protein [Bdellovibrionales bacterium]
EEALIEARIPYKIFGGLRFYDRKEIKDIIAYLRLIANPSDNQAFLRVVNTPPRGVGARTIEGLRMIAAQQSVSLLQAAVLLERSPVGKNKGISSFLKLIDTYREKIALKGLSEIVSGIVQDSGYGPKLRAMKDDDSQSRLENLKELEGIARSMESISESNHEVLEKFLDRVSLTSSDEIPTEIQPVDDETAEVRRNTVSLMTLHLAKGLEFYNVFLTGLEEGLLPHSRSIFDPDELAEERRLCYVGITRAMRKLYLTRAETRGMFSSGSSFGGSGYYREVSRFALSIPRDTLREIGGGFFSNRAWSDDSIEIDPDFLEHSRK